ncbi:Uncharacterised protein [Bordetella pertussis]|nr:Uncharacterised protein [Bordetella pertussis]
MLTAPASNARSAAMLATMAAACGPILGACAWMVASTLTGAQPAARTLSNAARSSTRLSAPR